MRQDIFVTATNTNVGKTYATLYMMEVYAKKGYKVGAYKPIETGVDQIPLDGLKLFEKSKELNDKFNNLTIDDIVTYKFKLPAAPYVASKGLKLNLDKIKQNFKKLQQYCDLLFVEGAGGLLVPINLDFFMIDLAKFLNLYTILITPSRLGSINDTLLSLEILKKYDISHEWLINLHEDLDTFSYITEPFYKNYFNSYKFLRDI